MISLKLVQIGKSVGVAIPEAMLERLHLTEGAKGMRGIFIRIRSFFQRPHSGAFRPAVLSHFRKSLKRNSELYKRLAK